MTKAQKQKFFNKAYRGLKRQGFERARASKGGTCMYSLPNGKRCAVGQLIPKGTPGVREWVGSVTNSELIPKLIACGIPLENEKDRTFFSSLQQAHDSGVTPGDMKHGLERLARTYRLTIPRG